MLYSSYMFSLDFDSLFSTVEIESLSHLVVPDCLADMFKSRSQVHNRQLNAIVWCLGYTLMTGSCSFRGAQLWNSLNDNIKSLKCPKNLCTFCKCVVIFLNNVISITIYDWIILTGGNTCERHLELWRFFFLR